MARFRGSRGKIPISILVLAGLTIVFGVATVSGDTSSLFPINSHLLQVFRTTALPPADGPLPPVVARVGSTEISSEAFARQVTIIRNNNSSRGQPLTDTEIKKAAIDNLIRDAALYERARAEGITVSDDEVRVFMDDQRALLSRSEAANPGITSDTNAAIAANGDATRDAFWNDPKVIAEYRRMLMKGKVIAAHVGPGATPQQLDAFVNATVNSADVHIYINT